MGLFDYFNQGRENVPGGSSSWLDNLQSGLPWRNVEQAMGGLGGLVGGLIGQGSAAIPGLAGQGIAALAQLPGIRQPPQDQNSTVGFSPGIPGPPTVHDIGMARGNMMQNAMLGAHMGFPGMMQGAMGQMGNILQHNAAMNAQNQDRALQYASIMAPLQAAMAMHRDRMGLKTGVLNALSGGDMGPPSYPNNFAASIPRVSQTPDAVYDGSLNLREAASPSAISRFGGSTGLRQHWGDLARQNASRTSTALDLAGTRAQAALTAAQRTAQSGRDMSAQRLTGRRYGDLLADSMRGRRNFLRGYG